MLVAQIPAPTRRSLRSCDRSSGTTMALVPTAWGYCGIVWKDHESENAGQPFAERPARALLSRIWTPGLSMGDLRSQMLNRYPLCLEALGEGAHFHPEVVPDWFNDLVKYLQGYYTAALRGWTHPQFIDNWAFWKPRLDWSEVTPFQRCVLEIVATIPSGMCRTYGQIAAAAGKPAATRAVGAAIGSNPWPVLIPCHRVIGASGKLTGFSAPGGVEAKRRMLEMERV